MNVPCGHNGHAMACIEPPEEDEQFYSFLPSVCVACGYRTYYPWTPLDDLGFFPSTRPEASYVPPGYASAGAWLRHQPKEASHE